MGASPSPLDRAGSERHASAEELAAFALDPTSLDVTRREHIVTCPVCTPEAAWLGAAVTDLEREEQCPSVDTLVRFALGESLADEQISVAAHLRACALCSEEVKLTRATFQPAVQPSGLVAAIRRVVATLSPPPAALSARGKADAVSPEETALSRLYKAGDLEVSLSIEADGETYVISGVMQSLQPITHNQGMERVALLYSLPGKAEKSSSALVAEAPVSSSNDFDLYGVPAGSYRLDVVYGDQVIAVQPLVVP